MPKYIFFGLIPWGTTAVTSSIAAALGTSVAAVGLAASWVGMGLGVLATPFLVKGMNTAKTELLRQQYKDLLMAMQRLRGRYRHGPKPERARWLAMKSWRTSLYPPRSAREARRKERLRRKRRRALGDQHVSVLKPPPKRIFSADSDDIDLDELIDSVNSERQLLRKEKTNCMHLHHNHSRSNLHNVGARGRRGSNAPSAGSDVGMNLSRSRVLKVRRQDFKTDYAFGFANPSSASLKSPGVGSLEAGRASKASLNATSGKHASMNILQSSSVGSSLNEAGANLLTFSPPARHLQTKDFMSSRQVRYPVNHSRRNSRGTFVSASAKSSPVLKRATSARRIIGSSIRLDDALPQFPPTELPFTPTLEHAHGGSMTSLAEPPTPTLDVEKLKDSGNEKPVGEAHVQRLQPAASHDGDLKGLIRTLDSEFDKERQDASQRKVPKEEEANIKVDKVRSPPPHREYTQASIENPRRQEDIDAIGNVEIQQVERENESRQTRGNASDTESPTRPPLAAPEKLLSPWSSGGGFWTFFGLGESGSPQNRNATALDSSLPELASSDLASPSLDSTSRNALSPGYHATLSPGEYSITSRLHPIPHDSTLGSVGRSASELRSAPGSPCPEIPSDIPATSSDVPQQDVFASADESLDSSLDNDPTRQETNEGAIEGAKPSTIGVTRGKKWALAKRWVSKEAGESSYDGLRPGRELGVKYIAGGESHEAAQDSWESISVSDGSAADLQDRISGVDLQEISFSGIREEDIQKEVHHDVTQLQDLQQQREAVTTPREQGGQPEGEHSPIPIVTLRHSYVTAAEPTAISAEPTLEPSAPPTGCLIDTVGTPSPTPSANLAKLNPGTGDLGRGISEARSDLGRGVSEARPTSADTNCQRYSVGSTSNQRASSRNSADTSHTLRTAYQSQLEDDDESAQPAKVVENEAAPQNIQNKQAEGSVLDAPQPEKSKHSEKSAGVFE